MKKVLFAVLLWLTVLVSAPAQEKYAISEKDYENNTVEMADTMRQNGKIYVVVAVLGIVLTGLFVYAFSIDRKVKKLEKETQTP